MLPVSGAFSQKISSYCESHAAQPFERGADAVSAVPMAARKMAKNTRKAYQRLTTTLNHTMSAAFSRSNSGAPDLRCHGEGFGATSSYLLEQSALCQRHAHEQSVVSLIQLRIIHQQIPIPFNRRTQARRRHSRARSNRQDRRAGACPQRTLSARTSKSVMRKTSATPSVTSARRISPPWRDGRCLLKSRNRSQHRSFVH